MSEQSILEVAKAYIDSGIKCHPVYGPDSRKDSAAGKAPRTKKWQEKFLSFAEFKRVFKEGDNLGVVCGKASGIICIDIDPRNGGQAWLDANREKLGFFIEETTGSGGRHLYFKYPSDREYVGSIIGFAPGVDILADGGKQVVTAPSIHSTGEVYKILNGFTLVDVAFEADELPAWLLEQLSEAPVEVVANPFQGSKGIDSRLVELTASLPAAVAGESGNETTYKAALTIRDQGLSQKETFALLLEHFNLRCVPPWGKKELKEIVSHAYTYAKRPLGNATPEAHFSVEPEEKEICGYTTKGALVRCAQGFIDRSEGTLKIRETEYYHYTGKNWEIISEIQFRNLIWNDIKLISPKAYQKITMSRFYSIADTVRQILRAQNFKLEPNTWSDGKEGDFIALQNGILNIKTLELLSHSKDWFSFTVLPFAFDSSAECPQFLSFLSSVWGQDSALFDMWCRWMGYLVLPDMRQQKFALLIGESRAGKSTLARVVESLVGPENHAASSLDSLGNDFGLAPLVGKRLAVFSDVFRLGGSVGDIANARLISIVGNDPQQINRKNQPMFNAQLNIKIMMICNEIPNFGNAKNQLSNRMIVFPFNKSFAGAEDLELNNKLRFETAGIFNLALAGAQQLLRGERLSNPPVSLSALHEIEESLDSALAFKNEMLDEISENNIFLESKLLFEAYCNYCNENKLLAKSRRRFITSLKQHSPSSVRIDFKWVGDKTVRVITGLAFKKDVRLTEF